MALIDIFKYPQPGQEHRVSTRRRHGDSHVAILVCTYFKNTILDLLGAIHQHPSLHRSWTRVPELDHGRSWSWDHQMSLLWPGLQLESLPLTPPASTGHQLKGIHTKSLIMELRVVCCYIASCLRAIKFNSHYYRVTSIMMTSPRQKLHPRLVPSKP